MKTLTLFICAVSAASAATYVLELTPKDTKVEWTVGSALHTVHGSFPLKSGHLEFDPETGTVSGKIVVDAPGGESGNGSRDKRMHALVLESAKFPEAVFVPERMDGKVAIPGSGTVKVYGKLTVHGAAHDVVLVVQEKSDGARMQATAKVDVPYVDWGMKDPGNFLLKVAKVVELAVTTDVAVARR